MNLGERISEEGVEPDEVAQGGVRSRMKSGSHTDTWVVLVIAYLCET